MAPNSFSSFDDVPEAQRDHLPVRQATATPWRFPRWGAWVLLGLASALITLGASWAAYTPAPTPAIAFVAATAEFTSPLLVSASDDEKTLLGHRAYAEAPEANLVALPAAPTVRLLPAAAEALETMVAAAQADGIALLPLSGFRSVTDQQYLFFTIKAERSESPTARAEVSAPPGYSEHHTGYAVDLGDGSRPSTHVEVTFETTPAFAWLQANARRYNFEMSFPRDNPQNIHYEPWHWRFVGDTASLETFYQDR